METNLGITTFTRGQKRYELADYLGNVLATISDKRIGRDDGGDGGGGTPNDGLADAWLPDLVTAQEYYVFGGVIADRSYSQGGESYRYGFNGQEQSPQIAAGHTTALFWEYDARIGRRWNVDPRTNVGESPYACFGNNPVFLIDPDGLKPIEHQVKKGESLSKIARRYNTTVKNLLELNSIKNPDKIQAGQTLTVGNTLSGDETLMQFGMPELDFTSNPLTRYNNPNTSTYEVDNSGSVPLRGIEFVSNVGANPDAQNTVTRGGTLHRAIWRLPSVQHLIQQGFKEIQADGKAEAGEFFKTLYSIGNLTGPNGRRMFKSSAKDYFNKPFFENTFFSAEFWLGSYGFSMRVTARNTAVIAIYDSKTHESLTDRRWLLQMLIPDMTPTYQRYIYEVPLPK